MRAFISPLLVAASLTLSACGTIAGGQAQEVTLLTPGAYNARCTLDNGNRYVAYTGETIMVMRSGNDMVVDCYADGNRHRTMTIDVDVNGWTVANVANAGAGVAYDQLSRGLYEYPETITVDFIGVPKRGFELPEYHNKDAPNPYEQSMEYYGPGKTRVPQDTMYLKRGVEKRTESVGSNPFDFMEEESAAPEAPASKTSASAKSGTTQPVPKGKTADELTRSMNPAVFNK